MGISITSNFDQKASLPLDSRTVVSDVGARDAIPSSVRYEGLDVFVESTGERFSLIGGITNSDWKLSLDSSSNKSILEGTTASFTTAEKTKLSLLGDETMPITKCLLSGSEWIVNHNLGFNPNVQAYDLGGNMLYGEVVHSNLNQSRICFISSEDGYVIF